MHKELMLEIAKNTVLSCEECKNREIKQTISKVYASTLPSLNRYDQNLENDIEIWMSDATKLK
ncbi:hypothetical protein [Membranihabitans marinus]|uniref:hypothetical protein n=1 Tax=Membranihabitans marinus TaxID=1227546 RepID=UPI001F3AD166|nr:hypothetical protein [Membranihabitans marinus]